MLLRIREIRATGSSALSHLSKSKKLTARELPLIESCDESYRLPHAWTENVSSGGLCCIADQDIRHSSLVYCQLMLSEVPVPTLMRVQWVHKMNQSGFRFGLKFLLLLSENKAED